MSSNPLFSNNPVKPAPADDAAVQMIRNKVARAYGAEPAAKAELEQVSRTKTLSKHQLYMQELSQSGKSLAEIQTAWHHYYTTLPDSEKHAVWEEFYAANQHTPYQKLFQKQIPVASRTKLKVEVPPPERTQTPSQPTVIGPSFKQTPLGTPNTLPGGQSTPKPLKAKRRNPFFEQLVRRVQNIPLVRKVAASPLGTRALRLTRSAQHRLSAGGKLQMKHHLQSLLFGLSMGAIVLVVVLFSFFNEFVIAPFIQPSRAVSDTPIITTNLTSAQTAKPTVIVHKINVQVPVDFNLTSNDEETVQASLNNGVVHYPNTALPGHNGNGAYFGHSSQNIFAPGGFKFAFVSLRHVTTGDIFSIIYSGKVYSYEVFAKEVVPPTQVSVLNDTKGEQATAVLITCDPPGISSNRLVVWGKQISPNPATNNSAPAKIEATPQQISSNGPSLWERFTQTVQFWKD